jgi:hypothetical protein
VRLVTLLALTLVAACGADDVTVAGPLDPPSFASEGYSRRAVMVLDTEDPRWPKDPVSIASARIEGTDTLRLEISYGGGCRVHQVELVIGTTFMESNPVQAGARLAHDAGGDNCKALVRSLLFIDLTPLKDTYQRAYQTSKGTVMLRLAGVTAPIRYAF